MRDFDVLMQLYEQAGFTLVRWKNHPIWRCPCGHAQIVCHGSPCRGRGDTNARQRIARTLRACKQLKKEKAT